MTDEKPQDPLAKIEEQFSNGEPDNTLELFEQGDITLRTDLNDKEVILANLIYSDNEILKTQFSQAGLEFDLYGSFLEHYKRHKVSRNRGSRSEFVDVNRKDRFKQNLTDFANINQLTKDRT